MNIITLIAQVAPVPLLCIFFSYGAIGQTGKFVVDGVEINYEEQGKGETIVFVHGAQEDFRSFRLVTNYLSDHNRTIAYSRKYNYPNKNIYNRDREYSAASEAAILASLIGELGGPVHLVGHSFGGLIAAHLAVERPDLVRSLVLSEPALVSWLPEIPGCAAYADSIQQHLIDDTRIAFMTSDSTAVMTELFEFFVGQDIQNEMPAELMQPLWDNLPEMRAIVFAREPFTAISREQLDQLEIPMLILTSGRTMPFLRCINEELASSLPDAEHVHFPEEGHDLWMTNPEGVAKRLDRFIVKQRE